MLHTSTKLDNNPGFQIYVKKSMRQRLIEIITSFDDRDREQQVKRISNHR